MTRIRLISEEKTREFRELKAYLQYITREVFHLTHKVHRKPWNNEGTVAVQVTDEGIAIRFRPNFRTEIESGGRFPVQAMMAEYGFHPNWQGDSKNVFERDTIVSGVISDKDVPDINREWHANISRTGGIGKNWDNTYIILGNVAELLQRVKTRDKEGFEKAQFWAKLRERHNSP